MRTLLLLLLLLAQTASAATFVVTKETDDNGPCTPDDCALREAILAANVVPGPDVVEIPAGTYQLSLTGPPENSGTTGDLDIIDELELRGESTRTVTVIGNGVERVLHVGGVRGTVELSGMTVTGGNEPDFGGGVHVAGPDTIILRDLAITGNTSTVGAGGGLVIGAIQYATLRNVTISGNSSLGGGGGGAWILVSSPFTFLDFVNVTISGNSAAMSGGGLSLQGGAYFDFFNVTVANNTAANGSGIRGTGGSIDLAFFNVLVYNNDCVGVYPVSNDHNMEGPTDTCFGYGTGDFRGVADIRLGPLADNGGSTMTHALLPGSPAIDAALDADCPADDQRGIPRPEDGDGDGTAICDIGAFEVNGQPVIDIPTLSWHGFLALAAALCAGSILLLRRHSCGSF